MELELEARNGNAGQNLIISHVLPHDHYQPLHGETGPKLSNMPKPALIVVDLL